MILRHMVSDADGALPPERDEVRALMIAHVADHRAAKDTFRLRDLGAEIATVRTYAGRVVYELVQNALDRAEELIIVRWIPSKNGGGSLLVGNDGRPISAYPAPRVKDARLSDFHALLSMHTSPKSAAESVGNKGLGFRSVFHTSRVVEVWSTATGPEWWGMRLRHPARLEPHGVEWADTEVASFYSPEWLEGSPPRSANRVCTLVCLEDIPEERATDAIETIGELKALPLIFIERRARFRDGRLRVVLDDGLNEPVSRSVGLPPGWKALHAERVDIEVPDVVQKVTGLDLHRAEVRVVLPPAGEVAGRAVYWSYLPTEQGAGHGIHIHADFCLNESRRSMTVGWVPACPPARLSARCRAPRPGRGWGARSVRRRGRPLRRLLR